MAVREKLTNFRNDSGREVGEMGEEVIEAWESDGGMAVVRSRLFICFLL
ncbi:MAG: hypothetical protein AAGE59_31980 [Cyanobacteria bacterium P01_F01_bin.86]